MSRALPRSLFSSFILTYRTISLWGAHFPPPGRSRTRFHTNNADFRACRRCVLLVGGGKSWRALVFGLSPLWKVVLGT